MIKYNYNYAKISSDGVISYGPIPLLVITHHHEEWDAPVFDPDTGEPTGETQRMQRDWYTRRTVMAPTAEDYRIMGYLPVLDNPPPGESAGEGMHWERRGLTLSPDGTSYIHTYVAVADPPKPTRAYNKYKVVDAMMRLGLWPQVKAWLESTPEAYDRIVMAEDISEDEPLLETGIELMKSEFGVTDEEIEAILSAALM